MVKIEHLGSGLAMGTVESDAVGARVLSLGAALIELHVPGRSGPEDVIVGDRDPELPQRPRGPR